jgi:hypothetical protein
VNKSLRNILIVALVLRLGLAVVAWLLNPQNPEIFHAADTDSYLKPAIELATTGRFTDYYDGLPELFRTPGYPLFLVPGVWLGNVYRVIIPLQILLTGLTGYFIYKTVLLLFKSERVALLSVGVYTIEPLAALFASKILTETLFSTLFTIFLFYFLRYVEGKKLADLAIAAVILVTSAYVRPISYYLPVLISLGMALWVVGKEPEKKRLLLHTVSFFLISASLLGVWHIRNHLVAGYPAFSSVNAVNLYYWTAPAIEANKTGKNFDKIQESMRVNDPKVMCFNQSLYGPRTTPDKLQCNKSIAFQEMEREGVKTIKENLPRYSLMHLDGIIRTLLGPAVSDYQILFGNPIDFPALTGTTFQDGILLHLGNIITKAPGLLVIYILLGLLSWSFLFLTLVGFWGRPSLGGLQLFTILSVGAYFIVVGGGTVGQGRYRHPLMPILCLVAGYGLSLILDKIQQRQQL